MVGSDAMELTVINFITYNYLSLILLFGISLLVLLNRKIKIPAVNTIWLILALVFCVLIVNFISEWADQDVSRRTANYWTAVLKYTFNPLIICLEVVVLASKPFERLLILLPAVVNAFMMLILPVISDFVVVRYDKNNAFHATGWRLTPYIISVLYLVLWLVYTFINFRKYKQGKRKFPVFSFCIFVKYCFTNIFPLLYKPLAHLRPKTNIVGKRAVIIR